MDYLDLLKLLAASQPAEFIRTWQWAYPILETIHVIGLGMLFGGILAFDLRVLGLQPDIAIKPLARYLLPLVWLGFTLNAMSGALLFLSDATKFGTNTSFLVKMSLICLAGLNMAWFHVRIFPGADTWSRSGKIPVAAKLSALASIAMWIGVIAAGRMIAYVI